MVQKTGSDDTDLHSPTLNEFLGNNEEKGQDLHLFGKRSVVTCTVLFQDWCFIFKLLPYTCRLSGHQLSTLMNLRVSCLYHTFTTFTQWLVEGHYDFHQLPYTLKAHLNLEDAEQLKKIPSVYKKGTMMLVNGMRVWLTFYMNIVFRSKPQGNPFSARMLLQNQLLSGLCVKVDFFVWYPRIQCHNTGTCLHGSMQIFYVVLALMRETLNSTNWAYYA